MNNNMSAIYITETGHVIGAVTCNSNASRALSAADVATPSFLVAQSDGTTLFTFRVPASVCSVSAPIAYNRTLFAKPSGFAISGNVFQALSQTLPSGPNAPKLTASGLTITIPTLLSADTTVFAQIQGPIGSNPPQDTCVITGKIPAGSLSATLPLSILPGGAAVSLTSGQQYSAIVLVSGFQPFLGSITVS